MNLTKVVRVHILKTYSGSRYIAPLILYLGTSLKSMVNFTPPPLKNPPPLRKKNLGDVWVGGWVGPRGSQDILEWKNFVTYTVH
jgi:hypothetical protein